MRVEGKEHYLVVYAVLINGEDYTEKDLISDEFNQNGPKMLEGITLNNIAKKNGYEYCDWASHETDGQIKVTFKKRKECKCNDAVGKSCNCSSKS